jgi:4-hydroxythreonine-4-phosphate dehydrogenase
MLPRLALTAGDPSGIGPEIIQKAFSLVPDLLTQALWTVIGPTEWLKTLPTHPNLKTIDPCPKELDTGSQSYLYVETAIDLANRHVIDGMVTAPICKESWINAGKPFAGHTEMLATLSNTKRYAMAFASPRLNVMLATIHSPLSKVPSMLSPEILFEKIQLAHEFGLLLGFKMPRIGIAGLNPHAGESGHLGTEDALIIEPAIVEAQQDGILATGPLPADTLFHQAANEGKFDIVLAMYHDQGLAPLKLIAFHDAVNVTVGLPFVRTSPDHGTAFNIVGKGIANPSSIIEAMKLAIRMASETRILPRQT